MSDDVKEAEEPVPPPEPPRSVTLGGREYPLARLTLLQMSVFAQWANARLPDPYASLKTLPPEVTSEDRRVLLHFAYAEVREGPKPYHDPLVYSLAQREDGIREIFALSAMKADPDLTREQSDRAADLVGVKEITLILDAAHRTVD